MRISKEVLLIKFKINGYLCGMSNSLAKDIERDNLSLHIRDEIFNLWIDMRSHAFVKSYIQMIKQTANKKKEDKKASKKAEPALRETVTKIFIFS